MWYIYDHTNASSFEYFLTVGPEFEMTADWNMELYLVTDPSAPIRTTVGDYVTGEWPRTLSVPTILDPDWSEDGYILRVIYGGDYAIGELQHVVDELPGSSFEKAFLHDFITYQYFGLPSPYPSGPIYINLTVTSDPWLVNLNSTVFDLSITIYHEGLELPFSNTGTGMYYYVDSMGISGTVTIIIDSGLTDGLVLWVWSNIT
jgi:hypothetical protein